MKRRKTAVLRYFSCETTVKSGILCKEYRDRQVLIF